MILMVRCKKVEAEASMNQEMRTKDSDPIVTAESVERGQQDATAEETQF